MVFSSHSVTVRVPNKALNSLFNLRIAQKFNLSCLALSTVAFHGSLSTMCCSTGSHEHFAPLPWPSFFPSHSSQCVGVQFTALHFELPLLFEFWLFNFSHICADWFTQSDYTTTLFYGHQDRLSLLPPAREANVPVSPDFEDVGAKLLSLGPYTPHHSPGISPMIRPSASPN